MATVFLEHSQPCPGLWGNLADIYSILNNLYIGFIDNQIDTSTTLNVSADFHYNRLVLNCSNKLAYVNTNVCLTSFNYNTYQFVPRLEYYNLYNRIYTLAALMTSFANFSCDIYISIITLLTDLLSLILSNISNLFISKFIAILVGMLALVLQTNKSYLFAICFAYLINFVSAAPTTGLSLHAKQLIVTPLGALLHLLSGFTYDYFSFKTSKKKSYIVNKKVNSILLGILYAVYIFIGVFMTNGVWYFVSRGIPRGLLLILSASFTILFAASWKYLVNVWEENNKYRSMLRSFTDSLAFTCVAIASYCVWFILPTVSLTNNIVIAAIGSVLHLIASAIAINWEYNNKHTIWYGTLYLLSFLLGSTATTGIFNIYITLVTELYIHYIVAATTFMLTVLLAPDFYRTLIIDTDSGMAEVLKKRVLLYSTISYFLLFISFVVYTGLFNVFFLG